MKWPEQKTRWSLVTRTLKRSGMAGPPKGRRSSRRRRGNTLTIAGSPAPVQARAEPPLGPVSSPLFPDLTAAARHTPPRQPLAQLLFESQDDRHDGARAAGADPAEAHLDDAASDVANLDGAAVQLQGGGHLLDQDARD